MPEIPMVSNSRTLAASMTFTMTGQTGFSANRRYLLTGDIATGATTNRTFSASLTNANITTTATTKSGSATGNTQTIIVAGGSPTITLGGTAGFGTDFNNARPDSVSSNQSFTISGTGLTANITVTAPTHFKVAKACTGPYSSTVSFTQSGGTVAVSDVFVRFAPTSTGAKSGNITVSSTGATSRTLAVAGTGAANNVPASYYSAATGTGYTLKTQLFNIIDNGPSTVGYGGLWTAYATTDRKYDNGIWDMYTEKPCSEAEIEFTYSTNQCGTATNEGDCYNREHVFPNSWFGGTGGEPYDDLHMVIPTDGKINNIRDTYPFGEVGTATQTSSNGSQLGNSVTTGYTGIVFEPIDEYKGDIARIMLYMAVRYQSDIDGWQSNSTGDNVLNGTETQVYDNWFLDLLMAWHTADPVSEKEINRNNATYTIQGNRNPFVDNPSYVNAIWANATATPTEVSFSLASASAAEGDGTYTVTINVANPSTTAATTVQVALTSGLASRVGNYTTQTVNIPASQTSQTFDLTITDDANCNGTSDLVFDLQNVGGGNSPIEGSINQFTLSISDNDLVEESIVFQGFEGSSTDTWNYSSTGGNGSESSTSAGTPGSRIRTGSQSFQSPGSGTSTLNFDPVDVAAYDGVSISVYNASISGTSGNGIDPGDFLRIYVSETSSFSSTANIEIEGTSNARYDFNGTGQLSVTAPANTSFKYPSGNTLTGSDAKTDLTVNIPDSWNTVYMRVELVNNSNNEIWVLDDITISGKTCNVSPPMVFTQMHTQSPDFWELITLKKGSIAGLSVTDRSIKADGTFDGGENNYTFPNTAPFTDMPAGTFVREYMKVVRQQPKQIQTMA